MTTLDMDFVRQQFPAFAEPSLHDKAFFENAGGSYLCRQVLEKFDQYFHQLKVQPYYPNPVSAKAGEWMDASYQALAPWLNSAPDEIYFGPSTSQNTYVLANAVMGWLQPGDEIVVTNQDHEANSGVWRRLAERGIVVKEWSVNPVNGMLELDTLQPLLTKATKLLTFPHCSNILGHINPVADICALARRHDVRTIVDGVSFAGHGLPDVKALGCDIYLFSLYKVFGPHLGVMVIQSDMASKLANQGHYFNGEFREKRLYPAGPDHAQVAAAKGVADYFAAIYQHHFPDQPEASATQKAEAVRDLLHQAELTTLQPLLEFLNQHPAIRIIGPASAAQRAPTVSITVNGVLPADLAKQLGEEGLLCGAGHFYSCRLLEAMDINPAVGVVRFSMVHNSSPAEVERLIATLARLLPA
ncbi:aminotransferase class V-fold PLP-dependent enzyme [Vibrio sp. ABG19]|uniref:aminotransferase class V-fold PLP-dependent enzyme n=1 Tax=Vibrio sp. ABG19 TaxID=2817385 RepID=UPI00249E4FDA|nr:aminotransferase class V-fold PLP-dependent enzyme [Vibrio sp. ABG19]WGY45670.1 aminotransferase class V-fold PLP-dependent enzyme [Vibrio sp. ABG19]